MGEAGNGIVGPLGRSDALPKVVAEWWNGSLH
jgi:hypothetical protein